MEFCLGHLVFHGKAQMKLLGGIWDGCGDLYFSCSADAEGVSRCITWLVIMYTFGGTALIRYQRGIRVDEETQSTTQWL